MLQMPQLRKIRSSLSSAGRYAKERANSLCSDSSINEQYIRALRTDSYVRICKIVQDQLGKQSTLKLPSAPSKSRSSHLHLSQNLLSPRQETLTDWIKTLDLHPLIVDYFEDSLETCRVCELLILSVHQTRANNRRIKRAIKLTKKVNDATSNTDHQCRMICEELSAFSQHTNPFYLVSKEKIHIICQAFAMLRQKLKAKHKKTMRRAKLKRIAISIATRLMGCTLGLHKKRTKSVQGYPKMTRQEVLGAQLDEAGRSLFILIKHIDTMSVAAGSLYDKVENMKELANMCVQSGKSEMLKEVVKEFNDRNTCFLEQLEELENLACLCLHDINASRRSIMQKIMAPQQGR
ncbi:UPF0496 protein At1g20180-like [Syzygium oleosum]|uniref:UPF0496 protein At1g20180-like n=1 Tax=Syzygium oleosum TaxID=219896 RepID=UPI0024BA55E7|nr:UPF0496 protein At1g20180-like [Syzygium oleosum]